MRRAAQRDKAEGPIIAAHRLAGDTVHQLSGKDTPDLLVGSHGRTWLVEVKSPDQENSARRKDGSTRTWKRRGKLRPGQEAFRAAWKGGPVLVAYSPEESLRQVGHSEATIARVLLQLAATPARTRKAAPKGARESYTPPRSEPDAALAAETFAPPPDEPCWHGDGPSRGLTPGPCRNNTPECHALGGRL